MQPFSHEVARHDVVVAERLPAQNHALRAYSVTQSARPQRELEAEVFLTLSGRLRAALRAPDGLAPVRAAADARRVFVSVEALVLHPSCPFPRDLRAAIASIARRMVQEVEQESPDLEFIAGISDDFAAGLMARTDAAP
ncbi:MAG TPA: flagellar biosynthesis regulator FlaF [Acetobacteraceae bacterium]|jgi:hypothetical protein|nr:flagellar biosynthesis regulator FlaF [Acetobacteraceae bacterium]